jgi:magnesium-transporting ATPase (P-type)
MIQEAHVGVGIRGKEGLQAARASDFQINAFKDLQRLLLIHGRYSYYRSALVAQYSFYKSFLFCFLQIGYGAFSGFAGVSLFNSLCVAAYNAILFVPVVYFAVDKDVHADVAMRYPQSYVLSQSGAYMNLRTFAGWFVRAALQAVVFMVVMVHSAPGTDSSTYDVMGLATFMAYLWVQDFTMVFELRGVTKFNAVSIFGMHAIAFIGAIALNMSTAFGSFIDYKTLNVAMADPASWLGNLLVTSITILPMEAIKSLRLYWTASYTSQMRRFDHRYRCGGQGLPGVRNSGAEGEAAGLELPAVAVAPGRGGASAVGASPHGQYGSRARFGGGGGGGVGRQHSKGKSGPIKQGESVVTVNPLRDAKTGAGIDV